MSPLDPLDRRLETNRPRALRSIPIAPAAACAARCAAEGQFR